MNPQNFECYNKETDKNKKAGMVNGFFVGCIVDNESPGQDGYITDVRMMLLVDSSKGWKLVEKT